MVQLIAYKYVIIHVYRDREFARWADLIISNSVDLYSCTTLSDVYKEQYKKHSNRQKPILKCFSVTC